MWYLALIVIFIIVIKWAEKNFFRWETIIKYLWKNIYQRADLIAETFRPENEKNEFGREYSIEKYGKPIQLSGNIINSILDLINYLNKEKGENTEEETFGYGRFDFISIMNTAKTNPDAFKKLK